MGFNTAILLLNDATDQLSKDPKLGENMQSAILQAYREPISFPIGNHANAGLVIPSRHADEIQVVLFGRNTAERIGTTYGAMDAETVLRQLADQHGYVLRKKGTK